MEIFQVIDLFGELYTDEVLRIELINGNKIYCLPSDRLYEETNTLKIIKQFDKKEQIIIIDANSIAVICTMSRETYDLKLQRGELYV